MRFQQWICFVHECVIIFVCMWHVWVCVSSISIYHHQLMSMAFLVWNANLSIYLSILPLKKSTQLVSLSCFNVITGGNCTGNITYKQLNYKVYLNSPGPSPMFCFRSLSDSDIIIDKVDTITKSQVCGKVTYSLWSFLKNRKNCFFLPSFLLLKTCYSLKDQIDG